MTETTYRPLKRIIDGNMPKASSSLGDRAELCLLPLDRLVVDDRYQRAIGRQGRPNVLRILANFDWRKFTPVVVTPIGDGIYAIIDGQHRATAALMHPDIDMVPCMVIRVSPDEAAACFAAINGCVTRITPGQIWKARVTSNEPAAVALAKVFSAAEVTIISVKNPLVGYRKGETMAIGTLESMMRQHGGDILTTALQAVTQTGSKGNPGCLLGPVIVAMCSIVATIDYFQLKPSKLFELMDEVNLPKVIEETGAKARIDKKPHAEVLRSLLSGYLMGAMVDRNPALAKDGKAA
jgi:hypothetical protein